MKIVYLAAGAADMYCGSCLHDNTLAAALLAAGEDVLLVPAYTRLRTDEESVSQRRVLFGGLNVYLQQKSALFRHTPWLVDRLLDAPALIGWLAKRSVSVHAEDLGALTVSMLHGEEGNQRKEVEKLVHWLAEDARPDVVHLSNSMLVGMAREIRRRLKVPVVCSLSGEDIFLEKLPPPFYEQAREALRERAAEITAFVSMNRYFADFMADYLAVDRRRIHVIPHGLNLEGHGARRRDPSAQETVVGYFARITPDKGLHLLAEAFKLLCDDTELPPLRLRAAGYLGASDRRYLSDVQARLEQWGLLDRFEFAGELDRASKIAFLQSLDIMSVPTVYRESKGLSILEALANAVPVVVPAHGTFPELIEDTQGGRLHAPDDPRALAAALKEMILDPRAAAEHGRLGQEAIRARYTAPQMAEQTRALYAAVCTRAEIPAHTDEAPITSS
jgi:glycosyltransferase involved in cell wall biosynthesis